MIALLSGGIDSLVVAETLRRDGQLAGCVFIDYGHPAQVPEGWKAFAYCGQRDVPLKVVHVFGLDLGDMGSESGARVVPHRNAVLLAAAANVAGGLPLAVGANAEDQRDYSDCRRSFFNAMEQALAARIATPLIRSSKADIIARARQLGLARSDAWSCYGPGPTECGACPSCQQADEAWALTPFDPSATLAETAD